MAAKLERRHLASILSLAGLALGGGALISGCAVTPQPIALEELASITRADREAARRGMPEIAEPITIEEAIARALKYNLEHRSRMIEQALAAGQLEAGRFDMMPRLLAEAGYAWRDEENVRTATDSVTGLPSLANPYISSEKAHATVDLGFHWNILDFGVGYYNAKENADRVLIALERRRRAMHTLIQNVRTAFWRAAAAEKLSERVQATIKEADAALLTSRKISGERVKAPAEALRYQRNLLENLRLLESVDRELSSARIELASLIGAPAGLRIRLIEPTQGQPAALGVPVEKMEEIALANNADLREQHYNARIAAIETRRALLRLLPNLSFDYILRYDDDKYLIHHQWADAGLRVGYNLLGLLSGPSRMRAAELGVKVAETRRMALQMSVLAQVHLSRHQYEDALRQFLRADDIYEVDRRLTQLAISQEKSQTASHLDRIAANVTSILSEVRRYHAMAKVHEAAGRVQATLGLEPRIGNLDDTPLPELIPRIEQSIRQWIALDAGTPVGVADHVALPVEDEAVRLMADERLGGAAARDRPATADAPARPAPAAATVDEPDPPPQPLRLGMLLGSSR
jgi:outer membrane protein TolC